MQDFLLVVSQYANMVVPILLVIVLILLVALLINCIKLVSGFRKTTDKVNGTIDIVNDYLGELKLPLRVLNNVSMSIEALRAASEETIRSLFDKLQENYQYIKQFLTELWNSVFKKDNADDKSDEIEIVDVTKNEDKEEHL